jgi:hypothetical protein
MGNVNFNFYNFNSTNVQTDLWAGVNPVSLRGVNDILNDIFNSFDKLFSTLGGNLIGDFLSLAPGGCCSPPVPSDSTHPTGSLRAEGSVITTPGGYKIEATGKFEWQITGPDGKTTRVWGDPHVAEGDGGKWDFKRNSTFVLGDGTRINVTTAPYGNSGMTVTQSLEIISGNERVTVSGIDKGKGVVGQVTQDGYAHANSFSGDVFVMGSETDDWSYQGREIIGSENGGESFKLGGELAAGNTPVRGYEFSWAALFRAMAGDFSSGWNDSWLPNRFGSNPYYDGPTWTNQFTGTYDRLQHRRQLAEAFRLIGSMFNLLARLADMSDRMYTMRNRAMYA